MSAAELDACLAALSDFGVERLSRLSAQQRREVGAGLENLQAETAKTLRMHTVQSLNPRAKPRETIAALLDEMKGFVGRVCSHVTESCLDRWDAEIESYSADLPVKGRLLMQGYTDSIANEQADRKARSEQELEKKLERMRAASQAEVETRAQSALHGLRKEQEQAFVRLEADVAAGRERIAELEAQTELAEELVASLRGTLVERTQMLEEANESLRRDARIKESHQEMHLKRKDEEIRKLALERDNALRRRQGLEAEAVAEPEPEPVPLPLLEPEPEPEPEPAPGQSESTRLETAAELNALSRKLQTAVDACARVTKERDMLLTLASDRNERAEDISSLMAQLSEVTKERDLLLEVVNGAKASADAAGTAPEAAGAVAAAPAPAVPAATVAVEMPLPPAAATVPPDEEKGKEEAGRSGFSEGESLAEATELAGRVESLANMMSKDRERRGELQALRDLALQTSAASNEVARVDIGLRPSSSPVRDQSRGPDARPREQSTSDERGWAVRMQSQAAAQKRPASAPVGRSASMDAPPSVSVINLNEEMAAEQRASGGVLGARPVTRHSFHAASSTPSLGRQLSLADFVNPSRQRATAAQGQGRPSSAGPVVGGRRARGIHITAPFAASS